MTCTPSATRILSNSIYSNKGLGIDLGDDGVTLNTPGGPHSGPNNFQNFPVLYPSITYNGKTYVSGTLNSTPDAVFTVQFFANAAADPSGYGEGQTYLGHGHGRPPTPMATEASRSVSRAVPSARRRMSAPPRPTPPTIRPSSPPTFPSPPPAKALFAVNDQYHIDYNTSLVVAAPGVQANDIATNGKAFTSILVTGPAHGTVTLNADGSFTYTPKTGFIGTDRSPTRTCRDRRCRTSPR